MSYKPYHVAVSITVIVVISIFSLSYDKENKIKNSKYEKQESMGVDDEGGVITPLAKKFVLKLEQKKRKAHKSDVEKMYDSEDSDEFVTRIENEIKDSMVFDEGYDMFNDNIEENYEGFMSEGVALNEEKILGSQENMILAMNSSRYNEIDEGTNLQDNIEEAYDEGYETEY